MRWTLVLACFSVLSWSATGIWDPADHGTPYQCGWKCLPKSSPACNARVHSPCTHGGVAGEACCWREPLKCDTAGGRCFTQCPTGSSPHAISGLCPGTATCCMPPVTSSPTSTSQTSEQGERTTRQPERNGYLGPLLEPLKPIAPRVAKILNPKLPKLVIPEHLKRVSPNPTPKNPSNENADTDQGAQTPPQEDNEPCIFTAPMTGYISSSFGPRRITSSDYHDGVDIVAHTADKNIYSVAAGTVVTVHSGCDPCPASTDCTAKKDERPACCNCGNSAGNWVKIRHTELNGWESQYAHLEKGSIRVRRGETVTQGQLIGKQGTTGRVTGPHLHFTLGNGKLYEKLPGQSSGYRKERMVNACDGINPTKVVQPPAGYHLHCPGGGGRRYGHFVAKSCTPAEPDVLDPCTHNGQSGHCKATRACTGTSVPDVDACKGNVGGFKTGAQAPIQCCVGETQ